MPGATWRAEVNIGLIIEKIRLGASRLTVIGIGSAKETAGKTRKPKIKELRSVFGMNLKKIRLIDNLIVALGTKTQNPARWNIASYSIGRGF